MPVIPMVLINGVDGIGTGWSSKVPNYNPRDVISNLRRKIEGDNLEPMKPYYAGFTGEVSQYLVPFNFCNEWGILTVSLLFASRREDRRRDPKQVCHQGKN